MTFFGFVNVILVWFCSIFCLCECTRFELDHGGSSEPFCMSYFALINVKASPAPIQAKENIYIYITYIMIYDLPSDYIGHMFQPRF